MNSDIQGISPAEFGREWKDVYDKTFSGRDLDDRPFLDPSWRQLCMGAPAYYFVEKLGGELTSNERAHCDTYDALLAAIGKAGDSEIVQFLRGGPHRNPSIFRLNRLTIAGVQQLRMTPDDGFDRHLFGRSGAWGLSISWEEEIAVVGGVNSFVSSFLEASGGEDSVRRDFLSFSNYLLSQPGKWSASIARLKSQSGW